MTSTFVPKTKFEIDDKCIRLLIGPVCRAYSTLHRQSYEDVLIVLERGQNLLGPWKDLYVFG